MITMTASAFNSGLLIEAEDLVPYLGHEKLRIVDLSRASVYEQLHIPHALHLQPKLLVRQEEHTMGLLPDVEGLQALIAYLNISPEHHVVAYDDEGGAWAGDRKSTRLNSSHVKISYAVFCLKKKKGHS